MSHVILAYPGNEALSASLAADSSAETVPVEFRHFPDGEIYWRVAGEVAGRTAIIACGLERPNEKAIGLFLLASTLRELGARRILLAAPYLSYMRQDRSFHPGEGVSARYFAQFLSGAVDGLVSVDPHLHRIHDLREIYTIPTRVVSAAPMISTWIAQNIDAPVLIGPDSESEQWVSQVARDANCPFVVLEKKRYGDRSVEVSVPDIAQLRDRTPVLIDDIISTAKTMIAAVQGVLKAGQRAPVCLGVHAIFADAAYDELKRAGGARIVTCNTIPHQTNVINVHPAVARAISDLL